MGFKSAFGAALPSADVGLPKRSISTAGSPFGIVSTPITPHRVASVSSSERESPRETQKLIFLDIDGVICCNRFCRLEENKMFQLQRICQATGAKICLSSDWRRTAEGRQRCREAIQAKGMQLVGFTPQMPNDAVRPVEIVRWLTANNKMAREGKNNRKYCSNFVAIDDRPLLWEKWGEKLTGKFVRTTFKRGLTKEAADECIRILGEVEKDGRAPIVWC